LKCDRELKGNAVACRRYESRESATVPAAVSPTIGFAGRMPLCNAGEGAANRDKSENLPVNKSFAACGEQVTGIIVCCQPTR